MLSLLSISGFLFMVRVNGCLFYHNQIHKKDKGPVNEASKKALKHVYFNFVFCEMFFKIVLKQAIRIPQYSQRHKILWLWVPSTTRLHCCFLCLVIETEVFLFIRRFQELSGILHNLHNDILGDLVLLLSKLACGHPFDLLTNMYWSLRTDRQGLPENFLNLIFNKTFYVAL